MLGWVSDKKCLTRLGEVAQLVGLIRHSLWLGMPISQYLGGRDRRTGSSLLDLAMEQLPGLVWATRDLVSKNKTTILIFVVEPKKAVLEAIC